MGKSLVVHRLSSDDVVRLVRAAQALEDEAYAKAVSAGLRPVVEHGARTRGPAHESLFAQLSAVPPKKRDTLMREALQQYIFAREKYWLVAESYRPMAQTAVRKYFGKFDEDAIQEAVLGMFKAAQRFDPKRDLLFSTYARWWVLAALSKYRIQGLESIRRPSNAFETQHRVLKVVASAAKYGVTLSDEDIAAEAGISVDRLREIQPVPVSSIEAIVESGSGPRTIAHFIEDDSPSPEEDTQRLLAGENVREWLARITDAREHFILTSRFLESPGSTLQELAEVLLVSRERVRQLEKQALSKLKDLAHRDGIESFRDL